MKEEINIDGKLYSPTDPSIMLDQVSNTYFLVNYRDQAANGIEATRDGYNGVSSYANYNHNNKQQYLNDGLLKILRTRGGELLVTPKVVITAGRGKLYPPVDEENFMYLYDDYTNPRLNVKNKFRAFNNQVRSFTGNDFSSSLIPDEDRKALMQRNYNFGVESPTYKMFEGLKYTFGIEMETSSGRLTDNDTQGLNLKCEFDGSLRETPDQRKEDVLGGEYITGVLKGDAGMYQLQKIANKLSDKCTINSKCGVHVHIGGIQLNKENIIYMYKLGELLQNEIYEMLPASRRVNSYCRKIKGLNIDMIQLGSVKTNLGYKILIDEYYDKIFKEVSSGKASASRQANKSTNHPMGSKCGYNKETQRYCWLNFVTALFNTKGNPDAMTLEFRSHSATLNYKKIKNWVKICMAFVAFSENHKASIKRGYWLDKDGNEYSINLATIVRAVYPRSYKLLVNYIENRKERFFTDDGTIELEEYVTDKEDCKPLSLKEDILCV